MEKYRQTIDALISYTESILDKQYRLHKNVIADRDGLYDVQIVLNDNGTEPSLVLPEIRFSYDKDIGYFLDIGKATLEYGEDTDKYFLESKFYIEALARGKLKVVNSKIFKFIDKTRIEIIE